MNQKLMQEIQMHIEERVDYHIRTGDYDTADAIFAEFYEWFAEDYGEIVAVTVF